jgi:hypothetical protein
MTVVQEVMVGLISIVLLIFVPMCVFVHLTIAYQNFNTAVATTMGYTLAMRPVLYYIDDLVCAIAKSPSLTKEEKSSSFLIYVRY